VGNDVPDFKVDAGPADGMDPFIMNPEGVARLFAPALADGPFPEHYEPFDTPLARNPFGKVLNDPAARVYDWKAFGKPDEFPFVATTYRLTEHFHFWTKHARIPAILQPEAFVEMSEGLARKRGIKNDDWVVVRSKRGSIRVKALVTRRLPTLTIDGQEVETCGLPIHWGFTGLTRKGYLTNTLTPPVGDANIQTPEFKAFLVDVRKA
jgi:formate dehydrogenase major subunit